MCKLHGERKAAIVPVTILLLLSLLSASPSFTTDTRTVSASDSVFHDFVAQAASAYWSSGAGNLPFPGSDSSSGGFALYRDNWQLEDNNTWARVLETHPQWVSGGWIIGMYPELTVPAGAELKVSVGFFKGATGSDGVTFEVRFSEYLGLQVAPKIHTILSHGATYDDKLDSITKDLSSFAGKTGNFVLYVNAGQTSAQDWAAWAEARIEAETDTTPPIVTISHSPSDVTTADSVTFTAEARDANNVLNMLILVNGQQVESCAPPSQKTDGGGETYWECTYTGGPYSEGTLTYHAEALDSYQNRGVSSEETVDVTVSITPVEPPVTACLFSISGTIHDFWHDSATIKIEVCEAETFMAEIGGKTVPVTTCKEGGHIWRVDTSRVFSGDLPGPDLTYRVSRLCPGTYIIAPVYQPGEDLCEWHGSWQTAKGQVVRIEDSNAEGFDFTFEPEDSSSPRVSSITADPEHPELSEDVVITMLTQDDGEIAAIWEKTDTVHEDGSFHAGHWHSLTVSPGMLGSTAGAQFSLTDDRITQATITARVCDSGGNSHTAQMTVCFDTCTDGIQNRDESGVDCGGPCLSQCVNCLGDSTMGAGPSSYLYYGTDGMYSAVVVQSYLTAKASDALRAFANHLQAEHGIEINVTDLDTSDEYMDAIFWYVSTYMGYRGDDINQKCINDVQTLYYDPVDYGHGDFPQPAYYTLALSGHPACDGIVYTDKGQQRIWNPDPSKLFYGDCEDYAIVTSALLRSLGVSHKCAFNAEQPGHGFNIVYYEGKYRVIEPQSGGIIRSGSMIGDKLYGPDNIWNDKIGAFAASDFDKVKPWQYTMNYPGCDHPSIAVSGGGFGEKSLWLDWNGWGENVKPGVADFDADGSDDIAAVRAEADYDETDFHFLSSGTSFEQDFTESATGDSEWPYFEVESVGSRVSAEPTMPGLTIGDDWISLSVSDAATYDHWNNTDTAPQLQYDIGRGDWEIKASVDLLTTSGKHHAGLMVYFSQYDILYFGPYHGGSDEDGDSDEELRIQRSGRDDLWREESWGSSLAHLKIERDGTRYTFFAKKLNADPWEEKTTITVSETPAKVGLILKTWQAKTIDATFFYFGFSNDSTTFYDDFENQLSSSWRLYNIPAPHAVSFNGDFDGDGRANDRITFNRLKGDRTPLGHVRVALSEPPTGDLGHNLLWHSNFCLGNEIPAVGDFNGDGRDDIVTFLDTGHVFVALSTKFEFYGDGWLWQDGFCQNGDTPLVGDFNGDGRDDIACLSVEDGRARIWVALANPSTITYDCHGGNICDQATFYTKAYWPDICP